MLTCNYRVDFVSHVIDVNLLKVVHLLLGDHLKAVVMLLVENDVQMHDIVN